MGILTRLRNRFKRPLVRHFYSDGSHLGDVAKQYNQNLQRMEELEEKRLKELRDSVQSLDNIEHDLEQLNKLLLNPKREDAKAYRMLERRKLRELLRAIHKTIVDFKIKGDLQQRVRPLYQAIEKEERWRISDDVSITQQKDKLDYLNDNFVIPLLGIVKDMKKAMNR